VVWAARQDCTFATAAGWGEGESSFMTVGGGGLTPGGPEAGAEEDELSIAGSASRAAEDEPARAAGEPEPLTRTLVHLADAERASGEVRAALMMRRARH
jgi:hypothetical protein